MNKQELIAKIAKEDLGPLNDDLAQSVQNNGSQYSYITSYTSNDCFAPVNAALREDSPDRKSTRLNSSHSQQSRMPSSA